MFSFVLSVLLAPVVTGKYEPTWASLDTRPTPGWYDKAKIGVMVHWGVYSVPSFGTSKTAGEWFWYNWQSTKNADEVNYMSKNFAPNYKYQDFANEWKADLFDANAWADLVKASGAQYFTITTKHHDGFTLWPSKESWNWNSVDIGPKRDIIDELATSMKKAKIHFCLYHSLFEFFHPLYLQDKASGFKTQKYVQNVLLPQMYDYVNKYKPEYIWSDGDWDANSTYWNSKEFIAWLYNDSPVKETVLVSDRWGTDARNKHGDVKLGLDRYDPGSLQKYKWENAMTLDRYSWGFRRNAKLEDYLSMDELTDILAETISCGGNLAMNIGPSADGTIAPIFQERLHQMGQWLQTNGEAIYETNPWRAQNDTEAKRIWYTSKDGTIVYAIVLDWPADGHVILREPIIRPHTRVFMMGYDVALPLTSLSSEDTKGIVVDLSEITPDKRPSEWAWVLKLFYVE